MTTNKLCTWIMSRDHRGGVVPRFGGRDHTRKGSHKGSLVSSNVNSRKDHDVYHRLSLRDRIIYVQIITCLI